MRLIFFIAHIIKTAKLINTEPDQQQRKEILNVFTLQTKIKVNDELYEVTVKLRENYQNILYYYHNGTKIKKGETDTNRKGHL